MVGDMDGFLKVTAGFAILPNSTARSAKPAKFYDFPGVLRELNGSKLLSDINLRKPRGHGVHISFLEYLC
jgi:hypothetical protein